MYIIREAAQNPLSKSLIYKGVFSDLTMPLESWYNSLVIEGK